MLKEYCHRFRGGVLRHQRNAILTLSLFPGILQRGQVSLFAQRGQREVPGRLAFIYLNMVSFLQGL